MEDYLKPIIEASIKTMPFELWDSILERIAAMHGNKFVYLLLAEWQDKVRRHAMLNDRGMFLEAAEARIYTDRVKLIMLMLVNKRVKNLEREACRCAACSQSSCRGCRVCVDSGAAAAVLGEDLAQPKSGPLSKDKRDSAREEWDQLSALVGRLHPVKQEHSLAK